MKGSKLGIKRRKTSSDEHMLSLINVVFLLLIFFMIAGRLTTADPFKVSPAKSVSELDPTIETAIIHISSNGELAFQHSSIDDAGLKEKVRSFLSDHPKGILQLKADAQYQASKVLQLMETLRDVGVKKVSLITQRSHKP
jgi:biopolymer transport protein ExbD